MSSPLQESDLNTSPAPDPGPTDNNEPTAVCTDSDSDDDGPEPDANRPTLVLKMLSLLKELSIMALVALAYAALTNERPPKVSKSPAAYPFFPRESHITDWYKGQITAAIEEARSSDLAFVMFYAPWDAESQNARRELDLTAKYLHEKVAFAAVNCWQPGSECKRQYSKVYKWPVLIAYPTHGRGIQYNGPLEAFHMIRFLLNMCQPLVRPHKLDDLMGKHNIVVSANINVLPGSYDYAVFYSTALRFLERDPFRDTVFAVFPQRHDEEGSILLHNWNGTIKYDGEWSPESIAQWIVMKSHHLTGWVAPTGTKSMTLATFMQPGPTLILFTPKNPLFGENDYYDMLREVAYDYFSCASETHVSKRLKLIKAERARNKDNYYKLKNKCVNRHTANRRGEITNISNIWTNTSVKDICNCVSPAPIYTPCPKSDTSVLVPDKLSPDQLQKSVRDEACHNFLLAEKYAPPIFERRGFEGGAKVTGLACATNSSLKFVAIDGLRFNKFAERLGVDLSKVEDKSGVVIINEKMETHHVMAANVSSTNLRSFIYNFTQKTLSRSLRTKAYIDKSDHVYPHSNCSSSEEFCLMELSSENFLSTILQRNKVVLVFYYSKQCSFCNGVGYMFLTVAKLLLGVDDIVFARIDGESNLLPWEYTMESYPTMLFLPASGKSESRTFPKNLPITVPNLIGFVVTNVQPVLKLKIMWSICCQTKFAAEKAQCLSSLRMETLSVIGRTLKEWRISAHRQKILYKLQVLRHLHLLFAHSPDDYVQIRNYLNKLRG